MQTRVFKKEVFLRNLVENHKWTPKELSNLRRICLSGGYDRGDELVFGLDVDLPQFLKKAKESAKQI